MTLRWKSIEWCVCFPAITINYFAQMLNDFEMPKIMLKNIITMITYNGISNYHDHNNNNDNSLADNSTKDNFNCVG